MKRLISVSVAGLVSATIAWGAGINYNGTNLTENTEFTRTECGTSYKDVMKEVSGLACSRRTPGFLWAHGDENASSSDRKIIAIQPSGTLAMTVKLTTPNTDRDDWEDICTGVYNNTNYVFVGAIGDNDLAFNDQYYIYYFEEPAITSGTTTVAVNTIRYGYPDNKAHNTETLMYDNVEQMFYIADKVDGVCHLYKLPFRTDYGTGVQRLTEVCALGNGSKFKEANGGDITPDGHWMAIKNEKYVLLWERQGSESLSTTAQRLPVQIAAYQEEEQGESLAWLDATTFYTTSDSKKNTPIYQYVRPGNPSSAVVTGISVNGVAVSGFNAETMTYNVVLPYGTTTMPTVTATAADGATINVLYPISLPGAVTVTCTSQDGTNSVTYTINLTISDTPSTDATLKSLSVNGTPLEGFSAGNLSYSMEIAYVDPLPVVTAVANDANATVLITNVTEVGTTPVKATILVTAQDNVHQLTYTVAFTRAAAIKKINEIIFSNHYNGYIPEADQTRIQAYYLAGENAPAIASYKLSDGCTLSQNGNTVTLTGPDQTTVDYTLHVEAVNPVAFTADEIVFDGSEGSWVKCAYGWDSSKKWKFSKTDTDFSREIAGKTHVEFFLPACDTVVLKSMDGNERDMRVYVNGTEVGSKTKLLKSGTTIVVNQNAPFMLSVVSAQSSGDGGVKALRMARKPQSGTDVENVQNDPIQSTKVLRNGQILIVRGDKVFTITGQLVR